MDKNIPVGENAEHIANKEHHTSYDTSEVIDYISRELDSIEEMRIKVVSPEKEPELIKRRKKAQEKADAKNRAKTKAEARQQAKENAKAEALAKAQAKALARTQAKANKKGKTLQNVQSESPGNIQNPAVAKPAAQKNPAAQKSTSRKHKKERSGSILITDPDVPFQYQEAFNFLRTNIRFLSAERECKKIVVTSAIPGEGKSNISINLALTLSAANHSVLLVDADLRKPALHKYLQLSNGTIMGLTNIMCGHDNVKDCLRSYGERRNLYVVPCGVIMPNPAEMLGSRRMGQFIDAMATKFDYIILDTAPISLVTDAAVLSQYADGVILVVRQKTVTFEQAKRAKKNLEAAGANILGVVINDFNVKNLEKDSGYYYYDYYYSDEQYGEQAEE